MTPTTAFALIQQHERLRFTAERVGGGYVVGWAHTSAHGSPLVTADLRVTAEDAGWILKADLERIAVRLRPLIAVTLTPHQHEALLSFCHHAGVGMFRTSTLRQCVNGGPWEAVPNELRRWTRSGGQMRPEFVARREAEGALWRYE